MSARSVGSCVISFLMLNIPVKLYTSASSEGVKFRMITPDGNPIKQKYYDPVTEKEYSFAECNKGYEFSKNQFVIFSKEEMKALDAENNSVLDVKEFVPLDTIDMVSVENSYYLEPDKGGDKGFKLIANTMAKTNLVAIGQWVSRGKENLIMVRPYKGGLILHTLYYSNEVRAYEDKCATMKFTEAETNMATELVTKFASKTFDDKKYRDEYTDRVLAAVEEKKSGKTLTISDSKKEISSDLFAGLKASLESLGVKKEETQPEHSMEEFRKVVTDEPKPKKTRAKKS